MERIDITKIRGKFSNWDSWPDGSGAEGGDDTEASLKTIAEKINEIVDWINQNKETIRATKEFLYNEADITG